MWERLAKRIAGSSAEPIIGVFVGLVGLFAIGEQTSWRFSAGGADMGGHYALVYWFSHTWAMPSAHDLTFGVIARNPPAANILAALVGHVVGSPFRGMYVVALSAVVLIWCAIASLLMMLPGRRRWVAVAALGGLLALNTSAGPLRLQVHGFEIVVNFFFAQVVGQALVWWLAWFAVRRRLADGSPISAAVPIAIVAVLATFVHAVPVVELLGLVGCLSLTELLTRWQAGRRDLRSVSAPIVLPAITAGVIAITPGFRAQRGFSKNDGYLEVDYLFAPGAYVYVALLTLVVSIMFLVRAADRRSERTTAAVLQGLGFIGIAISMACLLQTALLATGEGSPYAVKKYIFGLLTVLAVDACVVAATFVSPGSTGNGRIRRSSAAAAVAVVALIATYDVLSRPGFGYFLSSITTLERQVTAAVAAGKLGTDRRDYAVALPDSDPWLDSMFTTAILRPSRADVERALLRYDRSKLRGASDQLLTAINSPYDQIACRASAPRDFLVVIDATCWSRQTPANPRGHGTTGRVVKSEE